MKYETQVRAHSWQEGIAKQAVGKTAKKRENKAKLINHGLRCGCEMI